MSKASLNKAVEAAAAQLNKTYGDNTVMRLGAGKLPNVDVIPTGSISLDMALGCGGYPKGRIVEIAGPESSGKTTLALHAVANLQKSGGVAAIVDAEHALDMGYAKNLGVDVGALYLSQPDYGEQALEVVEGMIQSKSVGIVVVDSVAALTPKAELEGDFGRHGMGEHARLMSQAMRKLTAMTHDTGTVLIFINQLRMKIGVMFGNPEVTTGGNALKFYASVRLDIRRREKVKETRKGEDAETVGNITEVKVVKNKMAPPFKSCKFNIIYGKGIDTIGDILDNAMEQEIISKGGGWYSYKGEKIGHGYHNASKALEDSPIMLEAISKDLTAKLQAPRLVVV